MRRFRSLQSLRTKSAGSEDAIRLLSDPRGGVRVVHTRDADQVTLATAVADPLNGTLIVHDWKTKNGIRFQARLSD